MFLLETLTNLKAQSAIVKCILGFRPSNIFLNPFEIIWNEKYMMYTCTGSKNIF